jgi:hypothetical protein
MTRSRALGVICLVIAAAAVCRPAVAGTPFSGHGAQGNAPAAIPAGTSCNGISNSSGNPTEGLPAGSAGSLVQRFVPAAFPFTPTAVCIAGYSGDASPAPYDVVIFSDLNGMPGTLLATIPATPAAPGAFPGSWMTTNVSGLVPALTGPIWAGPRITTGVQFSMDFDAATAPAIQMLLPVDATDGSAATPFPGGIAEIQVAVVAGAEAPIPALSGIGLAALAAALATGGALAIRRA